MTEKILTIDVQDGKPVELPHPEPGLTIQITNKSAVPVVIEPPSQVTLERYIENGEVKFRRAKDNG